MKTAAPKNHYAQILFLVHSLQNPSFLSPFLSPSLLDHLISDSRDMDGKETADSELSWGFGGGGDDDFDCKEINSILSEFGWNIPAGVSGCGRDSADFDRIGSDLAGSGADSRAAAVEVEEENSMSASVLASKPSVSSSSSEDPSEKSAVASSSSAAAAANPPTGTE